MEGLLPDSQSTKQKLSPKKLMGTVSHLPNKQNQVGTVMLYGIPIVSLMIESQERLCLAQISNTLLKQYSYNEIHNRRVALGITCVQCTPVQLEILRRAGAMPVSSRRCGMITRREAERLCKSFLGDNAPPRLPDDFAFSVHHECAWGCRGAFLPSRYNSSRAKCIKCTYCGLFFSPNKFIFHSHRTTSNATYVQPDAANFNSWRRHMKLSGSPPDDVVHAWEDVKAMFNGGTRKRLLAASTSGGMSASSSVSVSGTSVAPKLLKIENSTSANSSYPTSSSTPLPVPTPSRIPSFSDLALPISMIDYVWHNGMAHEGMKQLSFAPYTIPWLENAKRSVLGISTSSSPTPHRESLLQHLCSPNHSEKLPHQSAFRPVFPMFGRSDAHAMPDEHNNLYKRHAHSEDSVLHKKRYARDSELVDDFDNCRVEKEVNYEKCPGIANHARCDSVDKENDLRKGSGLTVIRDSSKSNASCEPAVCYGASGVKTTFKKEFTNETYENMPGESSRQNGKIFDVSRLISLKTGAIDENLIKFREFGSNFLEAISNFKADERSGCPGTTVAAITALEGAAVHVHKKEAKDSVTQEAPFKNRRETSSNKIKTKDSKNVEGDRNDGNEKDHKKHLGGNDVDEGKKIYVGEVEEEEEEEEEEEGEEEKDYESKCKVKGLNEDEDEDEDDEPVDVETTDDPPSQPGPIPLIRVSDFSANGDTFGFAFGSWYPSRIQADNKNLEQSTKE